jgi:hypothetical protein
VDLDAQIGEQTTRRRLGAGALGTGELVGLRDQIRRY